MDELFELCDLYLDEEEPLDKVKAALDKLAGEPPDACGEWRGCGPLGRTPLHALCANVDCEPVVAEATARLLLANGVPVDQRDVQGNTALHVLCTSNHTADAVVALAHALLDCGASCTLEDAAGRTPCSLAEGSEVSGGWRQDGDGNDDASDTGPPQPELADLLRRRMILSHHGLGHRVVMSGGRADVGVVVAGEGSIRARTPPPVGCPEPESEPESPVTTQLTVLLLGPGCSRSPSRLAAIETYHSVECPELPEPDEDPERCVSLTLDAIDSYQPDLIVCESRGTIILALLLSRR